MLQNAAKYKYLGYVKNYKGNMEETINKVMVKQKCMEKQKKVIAVNTRCLKKSQDSIQRDTVVSECDLTLVFIFNYELKFD